MHAHIFSDRACRLFSRGVIFTRARVSLGVLSLRKNGGLLAVQATFKSGHDNPVLINLADEV